MTDITLAKIKREVDQLLTIIQGKVLIADILPIVKQGLCYPPVSPLITTLIYFPKSF